MQIFVCIIRTLIFIFWFLLYTIDNEDKIVYNVSTNKSYGAVRVSAGILRYDKRGGLDNPVIMSTFKLNDNNNVALAA